MKTFKARRKKKKKKVFIIFIFFFVFSYVYMINYLNKHSLNKNILNNDLNFINFNALKTITNYTDNIINEPINLLNYNVRVVDNKKQVVKKASYTVEEIKKTEAPQQVVFSPIAYIYNTHETEEYYDYTVVDAAKYLTDLLNNAKISSFKEEKKVKTFLQENNYNYNWSYVGSKKYLKEAKNIYPTLNYFFDIHRDALSKQKSTLINDNKAYAKIMFIVGLDNPSFEGNLNNAKKLNDIINNIIPGISRGISQKSGKTVNGVYNQDISENLFLIEVGGNENTKEEVKNTIEIVYKAIEEYIRGVI